jgi:predicted phage terminase large subunit-like protein
VKNENLPENLWKYLQSDLLYFTSFFFKQRNNTPFIIAPHHRLICNSLERIYYNEIENLCINIPPRYSKTEIASINFPAWCYARNPKCNFLILSHSDTLVNDISIKIKSIMNDPVYKDLFGIEFKEDQNTKSLWYTKHGGCLHVASIYGQITGFGAGILGAKEFSGAVILDDPNKIKEVESDTMREAINETLINTVMSRCNDHKTPINVIQQRTHLQDVSGFLLNGGMAKNFTHLNLPILNENNEPLWPLKHDLEAIEKLRNGEQTAHVFETQYMQNPSPREGYAFPIKELNFMHPDSLKDEKIIGRVGAMDTKLEGSDFFATIVANVYTDKRVFIKDVIFSDESYLILEPLSHRLLKEYRPSGLFKVETNAAGVIFYNNLRDKFPNFNIIGQVSPGTSSKLSRILLQERYIKNHFIFRSDYKDLPHYNRFMKNLTTFLRNGTSKHDDAADVCAMLAAALDITNR